MVGELNPLRPGVEIVTDGHSACGWIQHQWSKDTQQLSRVNPTWVRLRILSEQDSPRLLIAYQSKDIRDGEPDLRCSGIIRAEVIRDDSVPGQNNIPEASFKCRQDDSDMWRDGV